MTWISHKALTFSILFVTTNNLWFSLVATVGAILPDFLEGTGFLSLNPYTQYRWRQNHRKITHWIFPYLFLLLIAWIMFKGNPFTFKPDFQFVLDNRLIFWILFSVCVGAIFHILQDAISGKIPLLNPKRKDFGVRLIPTKSTIEYIFTIAIILIIFMVRY